MRWHWASDKKSLVAACTDPSGRQCEKRGCCGEELYVTQSSQSQRLHVKDSIIVVGIECEIERVVGDEVTDYVSQLHDVFVDEAPSLFCRL